MRRLFFLLALAATLSGCGDPQVKRAPLPLVSSAGASPGEVFWFDSEASTLIVLTGENAQSMAEALAWPDRLVAVAPARPCGDNVGATVKAVQDFAVRAGRPAPGAPIVVDLDGAGAMAFAASARTGDARAVVAVNYCPGAAPPSACAPAAGEGRSLMPIIAIPDTAHCTAADVNATLAAFEDARAIAPVGGTVDLVSTIVTQVIGNLEERTEGGNALDLPLVELPATGTSLKQDDRLAIIYSGDGGWADIDSELGEELSKRGVAVVGLDSLKYFWRRKEPAVAAVDLDRMIAHYTGLWSRKRVVLIGYSFGADMLPFLWTELSAASRAKVSHMALLGLSPETSFEITVGGWVGVESRDAVPTAPAVKHLAGTHVLCVQAAEDDEDPCPALGIEAIKLPGDHHFDRDYKKLAAIILARTAKP